MMNSSEKIDFGAMRSGTAAVATPYASQLQARFSRLITLTKYSAGYFDSTSVVSYPMTWSGGRTCRKCIAQASKQ